MFSRNRPDDDFEPTQCPVCKTIFGRRDKTTIFKAHCKECRATFYFKPWTDTPSVIMDRDAELKCGCGRCNR